VARTITVWLPGLDWPEAMGGLPDGMTADVWTGGDQLPDSADEVEVLVLPFGVPDSRLPMLGSAAAPAAWPSGEPLRNVVGARGYRP